MKDFLLTEIIKDAGDFCEWCTHPCKDEDKYEMLVICIIIQKEFLAVCRKINLILGYNVSNVMMCIMEIFEKLTEDVLKQAGTATSGIPVSLNKSDNESKNIGCSQIFLISQFIEGSYLNKSYNNDWALLNLPLWNSLPQIIEELPQGTYEAVLMQRNFLQEFISTD